MTYKYVIDRKTLLVLVAILAILGISLFALGLQTGKALERSESEAASHVASEAESWVGSVNGGEAMPNAQATKGSSPSDALADAGVSKVARGAQKAPAGESESPTKTVRQTSRKPKSAAGRQVTAPKTNVSRADASGASGQATPVEVKLYELQLAQVESALEAEREVERWRASGLSPYVVAVATPNGAARFTVRIGPFAQKEIAIQTQQRLLRDEQHQSVLRWRRGSSSPSPGAEAGSADVAGPSPSTP